MQSIIEINTPDGASLEVWAPDAEAPTFRVDVNGSIVASFDPAQELDLIRAVAKRMGPSLPTSLRDPAQPGTWVADFQSARGERIWVLSTQPGQDQPYEIVSRGISHHGACDLRAVLRAMAFYAHCEPKPRRGVQCS